MYLFNCDCVMKDDGNVEFCMKHWYDYLITGNAFIELENEQGKLHIANIDKCKEFGKSMFDAIKSKIWGLYD